MCAWGPNLLGYRHPEVEAAAQAQAALGDCLNGPTPRFVELAEAWSTPSPMPTGCCSRRTGPTPPRWR
jgi:glutamate-1-semialdehyde aminotransferase